MPVSFRHRSPRSGDFLCCIPGCPRHTLRRGNKLCKTCWQEYGHIKPRPEWLRFLINYEERERYYEESGQGRMIVSLEAAIESGSINPESIEILRRPSVAQRRPRRRRGQRGRPRTRCHPASTTAATTATTVGTTTAPTITPVQHSIKMTR